MSAVTALCGVSLMLACVLQVSHGQASEPTVTGQTPASTPPLIAPCLVDDLFAVLREEVGIGGALANSSSALFGLCTATNPSAGALLSELVEEIRREGDRSGLEVLFPDAALVSEEAERGAFLLTFVLPQSALLRLSPALLLLLAFESPIARGDLDVVFAGQSLQPDSQSACISGETQFVALTGRPSASNAEQKWSISVQTKTLDMRENLKALLIGGKSGSSINVTPLLLLSGQTGTDRRLTHAPPASLRTPFLCELKRFLGAVVPGEPPESPRVQLGSLRSLPPLTLGPSSSETLLAGMINSSAPTVFSFAGWGSAAASPLCGGGGGGELALSPALLEELRQRLEASVTEMMETLKEEQVAGRAAERLRRLRELSVWQEAELGTGEKQYCAFLLLKALQTVAHVYDVQRRLRATRAQPTNPVAGNVCGLRSLTVSLERVLVGPNSANINNCHGSCAFPLTNANNHAVQLHYHVESGHAEERAPCCVPVAYESLDVMELNEQGTYISTKPDVIAKECGCR